MRRVWKSGLLVIWLLVCMMSAAGVSAASVSISKKSAVMWTGEQLTLKMNGTSASNVIWTSNRIAVATVSTGGVVKARSAGTAVISAKIGSKKYTCTVTVKSIPVISAKTAALRVGDRLNLTVKGVTASSVKWSTSKKAVASVTSTGAVRALKTGTATITAKSGTRKFTCKVTVKAKQTTTVTRPSTTSGTATGTPDFEVDAGVAAGGLTSSTAGLNADEARVYKIVYALKSRWPEGTRYTNDDYYQWKGGIYRGGYGCAGFVFMLSDAAFGDELAVMHYNFRNLKVGDILRLDYNTHSVMVMKVTLDGVIVTEGNYNKAVHWGRYISFNEIHQTGTHVITRYGNSTLEQKLAVRRMRDFLPDLR